MPWVKLATAGPAELLATLEALEAIEDELTALELLDELTLIALALLDEFIIIVLEADEEEFGAADELLAALDLLDELIPALEGVDELEATELLLLLATLEVAALNHVFI